MTTPKRSPREMMARMMGQNAVARFLGIEVIDATATTAHFEMVVKTEHANTVGGFHGGMIFALADVAFGWTCNASNELAVTAGATIEILGPAKIGDRVEARVSEVYRAGRNALYDVRIAHTGGGSVIAHVRGRMRILGGAVVND
jgi:acyl-CoA thioesterase